MFISRSVHEREKLPDGSLLTLRQLFSLMHGEARKRRAES